MVSLLKTAGGYELWQRRAAELSHIVPMAVSDMLERRSPDGMDIGDWL